MNPPPMDLDPNAPGVKGSLFGLPFTAENSRLVIIPVPWEVTVSNRAGTARGPLAILDASSQVDLWQYDIPEAWKLGITMLPVPENLVEENDKNRAKAEQYIQLLEKGQKPSESAGTVKAINDSCEIMNDYVCNRALRFHEQGKMVGMVGGDHSTPLGMIRACAESYGEFGILQIDAHADLRDTYEGFTYSHASIMFNALKVPQVSHLVQVGIRDMCQEEEDVINGEGQRVVAFLDSRCREQMFEGVTWKAICSDIISRLPKSVYISFDIDGLDPKLCPNTGTPVPGGLDYEEAIFLIRELVRSGRKIIGFDIVEVAPDPEGNTQINERVGAWLLYRMSNLMGVSQDHLKMS